MNYTDILDRVSDFTNSERWQTFLGYQQALPNFSQSSIMRILRAKPDAHSVASEKTWGEMGRYVVDDQPVLIVGKSRFFDLSQTDGKPIPSLTTPVGDHHDPHFYYGMIGWAKGAGLTVDREPLMNGVQGELRWGSKQIVLASDLRRGPATKTLAHELTHFSLHRYEVDRQKAEIEAETVAYLACDDAGFDSSNYSVGYLAVWSEGSVDRLRRVYNENQSALGNVRHRFYEARMARAHKVC